MKRSNMTVHKIHSWTSCTELHLASLIRCRWYRLPTLVSQIFLFFPTLLVANLPPPPLAEVAWCHGRTHGWAPMQQATVCRVSTHRDFGQFAENFNFLNRKVARKYPTVLAYNYRKTRDIKNASWLLPSTLNHAIPLRLRLHVPWLYFYDPKGA